MIRPTHVVTIVTKRSHYNKISLDCQGTLKWHHGLARVLNQRMVCTSEFPDVAPMIVVGDRMFNENVVRITLQVRTGEILRGKALLSRAAPLGWVTIGMEVHGRRRRTRGRTREGAWTVRVYRSFLVWSSMC